MSVHATLGQRGAPHAAAWRAPVLVYVAAGFGAFAVAWALYVFQGSQWGFATATATAAVAAAYLAWSRSRLTVVLLVSQMALVGTDISGHLARGTPPLGGLRMLDVTVAAALVSLAVRALAEVKRPSPRRLLKGVWRSPLGLVLLAALVLGSALWALNGAPTDSLARADVRLVGLALATWLLTRHCREGRPRSMSLAIASLAPLVTAKALAIWASGLRVVGYDDRLQASSFGEGISARVVLVGGDTLLVVAPVIALLAYESVNHRWAKRWALVCFASAFIGLLVSGTRSSLLVAMLLVGLFLAFGWLRGRRSSPRRVAVIVTMLALMGLVPGAYATGLTERLVTADAPHVGLNFRKDEARDFFSRPAETIWVGEGVGARYETRDPYGRPLVTGWSHALPLWLLLKVGVVGVAAWLLSLVVAAKRLRSISRLPARSREDARLGAAVLAGLFLVSFTLGRAALPEGAVLIGFAFALLPAPRNVP